MAMALDMSRYDELLHLFTHPYDAADTELPEGMRLRRRQSPPRLHKYPRLLAKVQALEKAGKREDVVRMLTLVERWMASHPSARLLPLEIASLLGPAAAAAKGETGGEDEVVEVFDLCGDDDAATRDLIDMVGRCRLTPFQPMFAQLTPRLVLTLLN